MGSLPPTAGGDAATGAAQNVAYVCVYWKEHCIMYWKSDMMDTR